MEAGGGFGGGYSWGAPAWAVRVRRGDGEVAGAGVLVAPGWVLTSAYTVAQGERITVEFGDGGSRAGIVQEACPPEHGGIAAIRLQQPAPAGAAGSLLRLSVPGRRVRVHGFPQGDGPGRWTDGTTGPGPGGADGRARLALAEPLGPDHAGAGVADALTGDLLGVLLPGADPGQPSREAHVVPAESIVRHLPRAAGWTRGRKAVDESLQALPPGLPALIDPHFGRRLAEWFRGDSRGPDGRHGDGSQVKISLVRTDDTVRLGTLRRSLLLADRELRPHSAESAGTGGADDPAVPPPGGLDLAVDVTGRTAHWLAQRVADRLGLPADDPAPPEERIQAARPTLTLVVAGVDESDEPGQLLDLLAQLRAREDRLLLVFRHDTETYARARSQLVIEPNQQRHAALVERLERITGPLARAFYERRAVVRADTDRALDALVRAEALRTRVAGTTGVLTAHGRFPDAGRYERSARRYERRLREANTAMDRLIERRKELAGRLTAYRALYQAAAVREDLAADALYREAQELLAATPCEMPAAEAAVARYTEFVDAWTGDSRPDAGPVADEDPEEDPEEDPAGPGGRSVPVPGAEEASEGPPGSLESEIEPRAHSIPHARGAGADEQDTARGHEAGPEDEPEQAPGGGAQARTAPQESGPGAVPPAPGGGRESGDVPPRPHQPPDPRIAFHARDAERAPYAGPYRQDGQGGEGAGPSR
jgi:hypothetical protein